MMDLREVVALNTLLMTLKILRGEEPLNFSTCQREKKKASKILFNYFTIYFSDANFISLQIKEQSDYIITPLDLIGYHKPRPFFIHSSQASKKHVICFRLDIIPV